VSEIPPDLHYTAEHEWIRRTGDNTVRVGITDFAQSALTAGMNYDHLLQRIMQLGKNYPAAWRAVEP